MRSTAVALQRVARVGVLRPDADLAVARRVRLVAAAIDVVALPADRADVWQGEAEATLARVAWSWLTPIGIGVQVAQLPPVPP